MKIDKHNIARVIQRVKESQVTFEDALSILKCPDDQLPWIFSETNQITRARFGNRIRLCSIVNAKSGLCGQDCSFCAQSAHHKARIEKYEFLKTKEIVKAAKSAKSLGASEFSIVTSGKGLKGADLEKAVRGIKAIGDIGIKPCVSIGVQGEKAIKALKGAGLKRFHHNLEACGSFYPKICSTREYKENILSVKEAQKAGLKVCSGALFGLGESLLQRVELAFEIKELGIESIPVNFLNPIRGTPLENVGHLAPLDCLRAISMLRLVNPDAWIILCGGRKENLKQLQPLAFFAGASGMMIGNYLTTKGRDPARDLEMLKELGLSPVGSVR